MNSKGIGPERFDRWRKISLFVIGNKIPPKGIGQAARIDTFRKMDALRSSDDRDIVFRGVEMSPKRYRVGGVYLQNGISSFGNERKYFREKVKNQNSGLPNPAWG